MNLALAHSAPELGPLSSQAYVSGLMPSWGHCPQHMSCFPRAQVGCSHLWLRLTGSEPYTSRVLRPPSHSVQKGWDRPSPGRGVCQEVRPVTQLLPGRGDNSQAGAAHQSREPGRGGVLGGAAGGGVALTMRYSLSSSSWLILCSAM